MLTGDQVRRYPGREGLPRQISRSLITGGSVEDDAKAGAFPQHLPIAESIIAQMAEFGQVKVAYNPERTACQGKSLIDARRSPVDDHGVWSVASRQPPQDGSGKLIAPPESVTRNNDAHVLVALGLSAATAISCPPIPRRLGGRRRNEHDAIVFLQPACGGTMGALINVAAPVGDHARGR